MRAGRIPLRCSMRQEMAVMERLAMRRDGQFDHPALAQSCPVRRHVLYRLASPDSLREQGGG